MPTLLIRRVTLVGQEDQYMLGKLDVSENQIESLEKLKPLQHLRMLMELDLTGNSMVRLST